MAEPYIKKEPNDLILASDWNEIQRRGREDLARHDHSGGTEGEPIGPAGLVKPLSFGEGELLVGAHAVRTSFDYVGLEWSRSIAGEQEPALIPDRTWARGFGQHAQALLEHTDTLAGGRDDAPAFFQVVRVLTSYLEPEMLQALGAKAAHDALIDARPEAALDALGLPDRQAQLDAAFQTIDRACSTPWKNLLLALIRLGVRGVLQEAAQAVHAQELIERLTRLAPRARLHEVLGGFAVPIGWPVPAVMLPPVPNAEHAVMEVELEFRPIFPASSPESTGCILAGIGSAAPPPPGATVEVLPPRTPVPGIAALQALARRIRYRSLAEHRVDRAARLWACAFRTSGDVELGQAALRARTTLGADPGTAPHSVTFAPIDARLASLELSAGRLTPAFTPDELSYRLDVPWLSELAVIAVPQDPRAAMALDGAPVLKGQPWSPTPAVSLAGSPRRLEIVVKTPAGHRRRYTLEVRRDRQRAYIKADNAEQVDLFGNSVSLSGDVLAVGAYGEDSAGTNSNDNSASNSGAVYVFRHGADGWGQEAYLKASNVGPSDSFVISVSLSGDVLAVGAHGEDSADSTDPNDNSARDSGAVYVFRRGTDGWGQEAYLKAEHAGASDRFGSSVSLSGDVLAVGAYDEDGADPTDPNDNRAPGSGAAYVFRRGTDGWHQEAYLKASNAGQSDRFGITVSLSGDVLAVGAVGESSSDLTSPDDNTATNSGAVYVFRRGADGWSQEAYLKASNAEQGDYFGTSVSLSGDVLAVGAVGEGSADPANPDDNWARYSGAVYVFRCGADGWSQEAYLKASNAEQNDHFGYSVSLSGTTLAVGAVREGSSDLTDPNDNGATNSGAVYVFRRGADGWSQEAYLKASNAEQNDNFGHSISLNEGVLAIGAIYEASADPANPDDNSALQSGAVYVF